MESEVLDIGNRSLRDRPTPQYSSGKNLLRVFKALGLGEILQAMRDSGEELATCGTSRQPSITVTNFCSHQSRNILVSIIKFAIICNPCKYTKNYLVEVVPKSSMPVDFSL